MQVKRTPKTYDVCIIGSGAGSANCERLSSPNPIRKNGSVGSSLVTHVALPVVAVSSQLPNGRSAAPDMNRDERAPSSLV